MPSKQNIWLYFTKRERKFKKRRKEEHFLRGREQKVPVVSRASEKTTFLNRKSLH